MTTNEEKPLHIVELRAENFKRLRAITIRPNGSTVIIGGRNAQGKSSTLDAIEVLLNGASSLPEEPIRRGARKARIVADLGELVVERVCTTRGKSELVVKEKGDPVPKRSPQAILDKLCSKISFDPLEFARMETKKQDKVLKDLLGLDFSDIDAERAKHYEKRADVNKELTRLDALIEKAPYHADAPKQLVDVADLSAQIQAHADNATKRNMAIAPIDKMRARREATDDRIKHLQDELDTAKELSAALARDIEKAEAELPPEPEPIDSTREKLRTSEATNDKVRANLARDEMEKQAQSKAEESEQLTDKIKDLDQKKQERLAAAHFPVDGLGFDESGPTFNGIPLAQASQAERLRVSVAIGAAMNPRLKIMLVREASLLDQAAMEMLAKLADETGSQIWLERVGTGDPTAVIIEDGSVLDAPAEEQSNGATAEPS